MPSILSASKTTQKATQSGTSSRRAIRRTLLRRLARLLTRILLLRVLLLRVLLLLLLLTPTKNLAKDVANTAPPLHSGEILLEVNPDLPMGNTSLILGQTEKLNHRCRHLPGPWIRSREPARIIHVVIRVQRPRRHISTTRIFACKKGPDRVLPFTLPLCILTDIGLPCQGIQRLLQIPELIFRPDILTQHENHLTANPQPTALNTGINLKTSIGSPETIRSVVRICQCRRNEIHHPLSGVAPVICRAWSNPLPLNDGPELVFIGYGLIPGTTFHTRITPLLFKFHLSAPGWILSSDSAIIR